MAEDFDVKFHGDGESECTEFISTVRTYAKRNGKIRDNQWIADELYDAFKGKALKWYVRLPVDVRGDWELLQQALVTRWTSDDGDDDISTGVSSLTILPTPAAAARAAPPPASSRTSSQNHWTTKIGIIRARTNGIIEARYLSKSVSNESSYFSGTFLATTNAALALKVRPITAAANFYRLELVEHESNLSVLAAFTYSTDDWSTDSSWGRLVGVGAPGQGPLRDLRTTFVGDDSWKDRQFWTEGWQLGDTGVLKLCSPGVAAEVARFALILEGINKDVVYFTGPHVSLSSSYKEIDLVFEPLEN